MLQITLFLHYNLQQWLALPLVTTDVETWKMSLEDGLVTPKHRKGTKAHSLKNNTTAEILSSKSPSLHTIIINNASCPEVDTPSKRSGGFNLV